MAVSLLAVRTRALLLALAVAVLLLARDSGAQLSPGFYSASCPTAQSVVRQIMSQAVVNDTRTAAAVIRLFFHDCFVNGCDASLLLDDTPTTPGEKGAGPNAGGSTFGFDLIDTIKTQVEAACPGTVSCADILALAARDSVNLLGGPSWAVPLGRRDATFPNSTGAATDLPGPDSDISTLVSAFAAKGLDSLDLVALSGAHTVGRARCASFRTRVYCDANVSPSFASRRQQACPSSSGGGGDDALAPLDAVSPDEFDNGYYRNLVAGAGLLHSDQELFNNGPVDAVVRVYSGNNEAFAADFAASMIKLGNVAPLTGTTGEIRLNCRTVNSARPDRAVRRARCATFRSRVDGGDVANVNATFAARPARSCAGSDGGLAPLDAETPDAFDNGYFRALVQRRGLLHSDQELFNGGSTDALVRKYANDGAAFASDFAKAMVRLGHLAPPAGAPLEVSINRRRPN